MDELINSRKEESHEIISAWEVEKILSYLKKRCGFSTTSRELILFVSFILFSFPTSLVLLNLEVG